MVKAANKLIDSMDGSAEGAMTTERPCPRFAGIDTWEPRDALDAMIEAQLAAVASVRAAREVICAAVEAMVHRLGTRDSKKAGRLIYVGAGTSGRLAVQDGAELMPTFNWTHSPSR